MIKYDQVKSNRCLKWTLCLLFFLMLVTFSACAHRERVLYDEARKVYYQHNYPEAAEKLREFVNRYPDSEKQETAQFYLATSEKKVAAFEEFSKKGEIKTPEEIKAEAERQLTEKILKQEAEKVEAKPEEKPILISNVFFETDLRQALSDISAQAGIPIIPDDTVQGVVTLELKDTPLEKALEMVLVAGGFTYKRLDGYYLIGAADANNPTFKILSTTEYIKPTYLKAGEIPKLLSEQFKSFIHVCEERNTLAITASPEMIARIKEDIAKIDRKPKQIMLQSVVLELSNSARKSLGIDWSWSWNTAYDRTVDAESAGAAGLGYDPFSNSGLSGMGIAEGLGFTYTGTGQLTTSFLASIKALVEDGEGSIRATPRIATLDGEEAVINIGVEEYFSVTTGPVTYPYTELKIIKYGIVLKIIPYISDHGDIIVKIMPSEVSDVVGKGKDNLPVISRRTVSTTIRVKDGETIIIGGLIHKSKSKQITKVPILGDIPLLGWLFKNKETVLTDSEIMILITPRILDETDTVKLKS